MSRHGPLYWCWQNRQRPPRAEALAPLLDRTMADLATQDGLETMEAAWQSVLPPGAAGQCWVVGFRRGVARIGVADASWKYLLEVSLKEQLLEALNEAMKDTAVRGLRFDLAAPPDNGTRTYDP